MERTHRLYLYKRLPEIMQSILILRENYDDSHPLLLLLHIFFMDYEQHLVAYIRHEESTLIPYVKLLIRAKEEKIQLPQMYSEIGRYHLSDFIHHHTDTTYDLQKVRQAIRNYEPNKTNLSPYRILLAQLKTFELDLNLHSRIEEEIFIPEAIELEEEVKNQFITKALLN